MSMPKVIDDVFHTFGLAPSDRTRWFTDVEDGSFAAEFTTTDDLQALAMLDDDEHTLGDRVRAMQSGINTHLGPGYLGFDSVHCALSSVLIYHTLELLAVMDFMLPEGRARQVLAILQAADISLARIKKKHGVSVVSTTVWCETSADLARLAHAQDPLLSAY